MPTICYHHRCVSLPTLLWMLINAIVGFDQCTHTHTHTHSLSFCLSITLLSFPFFPFRIKTLLPLILISIEIQISTYSLVLISKVTSIRNLYNIFHLILSLILRQWHREREKEKNYRRRQCLNASWQAWHDWSLKPSNLIMIIITFIEANFSKLGCHSSFSWNSIWSTDICQHSK